MTQISLILALCFSASCFAQGETEKSAEATTPKAETSKTKSESKPKGETKSKGEAKAKKVAKKLQIKDIKKGKGALAEKGKTITVHYTGTLTDGTKFDSSVDRGDPFKFKLGEGRVIQGWEKGFEGMRVGGKRKLTIPPDMGYGEAGTPGGPIPPNATLLFDVELLGVE